MSLFALDIETTGLDRFTDRIIGVGIYSPTTQVFFTQLDQFKTWLSSHPDARFVMHRGSFDVNFLLHNGCDVRSRFAYDTKSMASILVPAPTQAEGERHALSLQNLGMVLLGLGRWKLDRESMEDYSIEVVEDYCLKDCKVTYDLFTYMEKKFDDRSWAFVEKWLMPATLFCQQLEADGVYVDADGLKIYQQHKEKQRTRILGYLQKLAAEPIVSYHAQQVAEVVRTYKEMYEKAKEKAKDKEKCRQRYAGLEEAAILRLEPFNWNSSSQLQWLFRDYYGLNIFNEREEKETTNEAMLKELAGKNKVARLLLVYRELEKLCNTCIPALLDNRSPDGYLRASFNIGGTRTGRLSSSSPNLQQIPRGPIRSYLQAENGKKLLTIDYSQIEVRLMAHLGQEKELINAFKEKIDPYSVIAQKLLKVNCDVRDLKKLFPKERDVSKTAGLSILYGTGAGKLQEVLKKELGRDYSISDCKRFIEDYRNDFQGIKDLRTRLDRQLSNRKVSYNLLGRPFYIDSNDEIYMKSLNTLVQGSASDLVLFSQFDLVIPELQKLGVSFTHRMVIHDEVVIELLEDEAELLTKEVIVPAMTTSVAKALDLLVPLAVEYHIGREWSKP